jgi:hypothetical protein
VKEVAEDKLFHASARRLVAEERFREETFLIGTVRNKDKLSRPPQRNLLLVCFTGLPKNLHCIGVTKLKQVRQR